MPVGAETHRCGEGCDQARKHGEQESDDYQYRHFTDANLQIRQLKFLSDQTTERKHDQRGTGHTDHTSNSSDGRRFLDDNAHQGRTIGAENTVRGEFTLAFVL